MTYQIRSNRSSNHIAGIAEATRVSGDGMTYARSACSVLTGNLYLSRGQSFEGLGEALDAARSNADANGRKLCKKCEKAALRILAATAQDEAAEARQDIERPKSHQYGDPCKHCGQPALDYNMAVCSDCKREAERNGTDPLTKLYFPGAEHVLSEIRDAQAEPVATHKVAIIKDNKGNERVHDANCADVAKEATRFRYDPCFITVATREDVARDWYADIASDNYKAGTLEWEQEISESMDMAMKFLPCCKLPSEIAELLETVTADIAAEVEMDGDSVTPEFTKTYGKAQARALAFLKARPGQTMTVSGIVRELTEAGQKTWFNATSTALKALAADSESGIVEVTGGNKAYKFQA